jgi:hypothetical protein
MERTRSRRSRKQGTTPGETPSARHGRDDSGRPEKNSNSEGTDYFVNPRCWEAVCSSCSRTGFYNIKIRFKTDKPFYRRNAVLLCSGTQIKFAAACWGAAALDIRNLQARIDGSLVISSHLRLLSIRSFFRRGNLLNIVCSSS